MAGNGAKEGRRAAINYKKAAVYKRPNANTRTHRHRHRHRHTDTHKKRHSHTGTGTDTDTLTQKLEKRHKPHK